MEKSTSTRNTDKLGEAIRAFANDFPSHRQPGHLLVGVDDSGRASGFVVTDALLRTLGYVNAFGRGVIRAQEALRRNGNPAAEFAFEPSHVLATIRRKP